MVQLFVSSLVTALAFGILILIAYWVDDPPDEIRRQGTHLGLRGERDKVWENSDESSDGELHEN